MYWLSFADPDLPAGAQFLGALIVEADSFIEAVQTSHRIGQNPGGEVKGVPVPPGRAIPEAFVGRLLSKDDVCELDRLIGGPGEAARF